MKLYDITVRDSGGNEYSLERYRGKVLLLVNTATECGFTPQYAWLEQLYQQHRDQGFIILDFPCNQFHNQAPGTVQEIQAFCTAKYRVTFPLFEKVEVKGPNISPLYRFLTSEKGFEGFDEGSEMTPKLTALLEEEEPDYLHTPDIKWNFTKFLVDREGTVVRRFEPTASQKAVEEAVQALL